MKKIQTCLVKFWRFIISIETFVRVVTGLLLFIAAVWTFLINKWGLEAWVRVLQDAFNSGFIRGTPFQTAQGVWAVSWQLGGQPLILVIIPYAFTAIFFIGISLTVAYLSKQYRLYKRFRKYCTIPRHPKSFKNVVSAKRARVIIGIGLILLVTGLIGRTVDPEIIAPNVKPSPNYLGVDLHISMAVSVMVTRHAILNIIPTILDRNNLAGGFYCVIKTPVNAPWKVSDINTSSIILNDKLYPNSAFITVEENDTTVMVAIFNKGAVALMLQNQGIEQGVATLKINGSLENGDSFQGSTTIKVA